MAAQNCSQPGCGNKTLDPSGSCYLHKHMQMAAPSETLAVPPDLQEFEDDWFAPWDESEWSEESALLWAKAGLTTEEADKWWEVCTAPVYNSRKGREWIIPMEQAVDEAKVWKSVGATPSAAWMRMRFLGHHCSVLKSDFTGDSYGGGQYGKSITSADELNLRLERDASVRDDAMRKGEARWKAMHPDLFEEAMLHQRVDAMNMLGHSTHMASFTSDGLTSSSVSSFGALKLYASEYEAGISRMKPFFVKESECNDLLMQGIPLTTLATVMHERRDEGTEEEASGYIKAVSDQWSSQWSGSHVALYSLCNGVAPSALDNLVEAEGKIAARFPDSNVVERWTDISLKFFREMYDEGLGDPSYNKLISSWNQIISEMPPVIGRSVDYLDDDAEADTFMDTIDWWSKAQQHLMDNIGDDSANEAPFRALLSEPEVLARGMAAFERIKRQEGSAWSRKLGIGEPWGEEFTNSTQYISRHHTYQVSPDLWSAVAVMGRVDGSTQDRVDFVTSRVVDLGKHDLRYSKSRVRWTHLLGIADESTGGDIDAAGALAKLME